MPARNRDDFNIGPEVANVAPVVFGGKVDQPQLGLRRYVFSEQSIVDPGHLSLAASYFSRKFCKIGRIDICCPSLRSDQLCHGMAQQAGVAPIYLQMGRVTPYQVDGPSELRGLLLPGWADCLQAPCKAFEEPVRNGSEVQRGRIDQEHGINLASCLNKPFCQVQRHHAAIAIACESEG